MCPFWNEVDDAESGEECEWCDLVMCKAACCGNPNQNCEISKLELLEKYMLLIKLTKHCE